jgi:hypothetical protein
MRVGARPRGHVDQAVRVRRVARADHEDQVAQLGHLLHGELAVRRRVADVVGARPGDRREALAQPRDDRAGLVDGERRLGEVCDPRGILDLERVDVLLGLDEHDRAGHLAHRALDLLVPGVADEHDRVALGSELDRLAVHLGDERAGRVDRAQPALQGVGMDRGRDAVSREDGHRALGDLVAELLDEHRAALGELLDNVLVVDDLLAHVDGSAVQLERLLDRLDGAVDAGAVAARSGEQELLGSGGH